MADYEFKYRLQSAPEPRLDGSACVMHDVFVVSRPQGDGGWSLVPGRHQSVAVPADELGAALAQPTNPLRIAAYKDALASNVSTQPVPIMGWSEVELESLMDANDEATAQAQAAHDFITITLALSYPVDFSY